MPSASPKLQRMYDLEPAVAESLRRIEERQRTTRRLIENSAEILRETKRVVERTKMLIDRASDSKAVSETMIPAQRQASNRTDRS